MKLDKMHTFFFAISISIITLAMIIFPEDTFNASLRGLHMWWEIVFPSLFPFFVISELLISFGVVSFMGVILDPLMRPLFKIPGVGGFAYAMGMATGFPAGAKISANLRENRQITKTEAERLISFTNSSSPLFIFGAVSVGFFQQPAIGIILAFSHYVSNFFVGLIMRFYGAKNEQASPKSHIMQSHSLLYSASKEMHYTRLKNNQPIGQLIGNAINQSIHTLFMIGGFIILFSVLNKLLYLLQITQVFASLVQPLFSFFDFPSSLSLPFIAGLFEITLGAQMTTEKMNVTLFQQVIITSMILGFSGFSVQAQVASIIAKTDIQFTPFFFARMIQCVLSGIITYLSWDIFYHSFYKNYAIPTGNIEYEHMINQWQFLKQWIFSIGPLITISCLIIYILVNIKRKTEHHM